MAEQWYPKTHLTGALGKLTRIWKDLFVQKITIPQMSAPSGNPPTDHVWVYAKDNAGTPALYMEDDTGTVVQVATTPTAFDDIGDPDAAGTIQFTTYKQILTGTKTDDNIMHFQCLGNSGNVTAFKFEQKTGNPTDGTLVEIVTADANMDPLVVSSSSQAGALVVGQGAGTVAIAAAATVGGTLDVTGVASFTARSEHTAGAKLGVGVYKTDTVSISNAEIKALRAAPKTLVAAPGSGYFIQFLGATLLLDYGSNVLTESSDNLVIEYAASGIDASAAVTANGFITANADAIATAIPIGVNGSKANLDNVALRLLNSGDGEYGGNAGNDTVMRVEITYVIVPTGF